MKKHYLLLSMAVAILLAITIFFTCSQQSDIDIKDDTSKNGGTILDTEDGETRLQIRFSNEIVRTRNKTPN